MSGTVTATDVPADYAIAVKLNPFTLAGPLPSQESLLWDWNYTGNGIAASGTFTTASRPDAGGYYQISGITGLRNGDAITSLEPTGDAIPGNAGYPVDNLINASGSLTANGFGYGTADGNYANPYYGNYLTPPVYQEVFTEPASSGFSEVPVTFEAGIVPGVTIATVVPGLPTDTFSLVVIQAPRNGALSLDGTSVQYISTGKNLLTPVTFSFELTDQLGGVTPVITVIAEGNGSHAITGAASGYTNVSLGNGNSTVTLRGIENTASLGNGNQFVTASGGGTEVAVGNGNSTIALNGGGDMVTTGNGNDLITLAGSGSTVMLGNGTDTLHGGTGDTISIAGNTALTISGNNEMVFIGGGNSIVDDFSSGLDLKVGPASGHDVLSNFASDPGGVVDLIGGIGGFTTPAAVVSALTSDGRGGTLLSFGHDSSLDFAGVALSQVHASNFQIG